MLIQKYFYHYIFFNYFFYSSIMYLSAKNKPNNSRELIFKNQLIGKDMNNTTRPFTQIDNELINSSQLSLKSKGLYSFMKSKPANWNYTIFSMSKQLKEGQRAIRNALQELKNAGWISYRRFSNGTGKYVIYDVPVTENTKCHNVKQSNSIVPITTNSNKYCINNIDYSNTNKNKNKEQTNKHLSYEDHEAQVDFIYFCLENFGLTQSKIEKLIDDYIAELDLVEDCCYITRDAIDIRNINNPVGYFFKTLKEMKLKKVEVHL